MHPNVQAVQDALESAGASGQVRVLPDAFEMKLGTWLAMHENLRTTMRCRATFDALAAGLEGYVER